MFIMECNKSTNIVRWWNEGKIGIGNCSYAEMWVIIFVNLIKKLIYIDKWF